MAPGAPAAPGAPRLVGAQPTKKAIKPLRKTRALHWQRILVPASVDPAASMWSGVEKKLPVLEEKVTVHELDALFADVKPQAKGEEGGKEESKAGAGGADTPKSTSSTSAADAASPTNAAKAKLTSQRFLSDKRFNAVAILLSFLPQPDVVVQAVKRMDLQALDKDQVAALHKQLPSEEEVQLITSSGLSVSELAKPEAFLMQLCHAIPAVHSRIDCWNFVLSFQECVDDLKTPFTIVSGAIQSVRASKCLPSICALVLHCGNYLNGSTPRGQADGFDLNVLSRLHMIKDSTGNGGTMLQFIIEKLLALEGVDFGDRFAAEMAPCRGAAEFPLRPALAASTRFQGLIKTQKNLAALVVAAGGNNDLDPFTTLAKTFGHTSEATGTELKSLGQKTNDAFTQLLHYLNPSMDAATAAKTQSEDLFQTLDDFARQVKSITDQAKAKEIEKAQMKKTAEIADRAKAARAKAASEKEAKAAAAAAASK
jgi:diaphanous 1